MKTFATKQLPDLPDSTAPDGSKVRILLSLNAGSMAHFELAPDQTSRAIAHRTVEEIWFIVGGQGEMWRSTDDGVGTTVPLSTGTCLTIPLGTQFQFRCCGHEPLQAVGVTMPPWPGEGEAIPVRGKWDPSEGI